MGRSFSSTPFLNIFCSVFDGEILLFTIVWWMWAVVSFLLSSYQFRNKLYSMFWLWIFPKMFQRCKSCRCCRVSVWFYIYLSSDRCEKTQVCCLFLCLCCSMQSITSVCQERWLYFFYFPKFESVLVECGRVIMLFRFL